MNRQLFSHRHRPTVAACSRHGFTLIEMLVVLFIVMLLAAVALPTVRDILQDQKTARAARSVVSFIEVSRGRAIAEGREVGVLIERLSDDSSDLVGGAVSIRVRQLTGVPSYAGESSDSAATLGHATATISGRLPDGSLHSVNWNTIPGINQARFDKAENQLLMVAATMYNSSDAVERSRAPIRPYFDQLELPGGKLVTILQISQDPGDAGYVYLRFDMREPDGGGGNTYSYPAGVRSPLAINQAVSYRIHRSPTRSNTAPLELPRGVVVDLNLSGVGISGRQFSQSIGTNSIAVIFAADGSVSRVIGADGNHFMPTGQLYFCLGDMDGVKGHNAEAAEFLETSGRERSNLAREKMSWIVISQATGRCFAAPSTPIQLATIATAVTENDLTAAMAESRYLARLSDEIRGN